MVSPVTEQTVMLGPDRHLIATLTLPTNGTVIPKLPIMLLTNSGVISRVGPHRINVKIARRLATRGIASIRFDLSGLGDSRRPPGTRPQMDQWVADTRSIMDWAEQQLGNDGFLMIGFCSGAEVAYRCSLVDERLRGLLLWDMYAYPTRRSRWLAFVFKLRRAGVAGGARKLLERCRRLLRGESSLSPESRMLQVLEPQSVPPIQELAANLSALVYRGATVLVMYCGGEPEWYTYPGQFRDAFASYPEVVKKVACEQLTISDHLLTRLESREAFLHSVEHWLDRAVPPASAPLSVVSTKAA